MHYKFFYKKYLKSPKTCQQTGRLCMYIFENKSSGVQLSSNKALLHPKTSHCLSFELPQSDQMRPIVGLNLQLIIICAVLLHIWNNRIINMKQTDKKKQTCYRFPSRSLNLFNKTLFCSLCRSQTLLCFLAPQSFILYQNIFKR